MRWLLWAFAFAPAALLAQTAAELELAATHYERGRASLRADDYDRAIADFGEALRLAPAHPGAYFGRGISQLMKKNYAGAIADLSESAKLDPRNAQTFLGRGLAYLEQKDYGRAVADLDETLRLNPSALNAYASRAEARLGMKDMDAAIADYSELLRRLATDAEGRPVINSPARAAEILVRRGCALSAKDEQGKAAADFEAARTLNPRLDASPSCEPR